MVKDLSLPEHYAHNELFIALRRAYENAEKQLDLPTRRDWLEAADLIRSSMRAITEGKSPR